MSTKKKIIYIDDDEINVELFEINFSRQYEVICGYSGIEGLELLNNNPETAVIISDMKMPGMNGIEFIRKAKTQFPDKKCYLLTGYGITPEIREALDEGLIVSCFSKPFNKKDIEAVIEES